MKVIKIVFLSVCIAFAVLLLLGLFGYSFFYTYYVAKAGKLTGINTYLLRAIGIVFFLPFAYGIRQIFHPLNATKRKLGYALTFGIMVAYNLSFFFLTHGQNFSVAQGDTLRWYSIRDGKIQYYDRPGFDAISGAALKPVTASVAPRLIRWDRGGIKRIEPKEDQFFDAITGDPLIWYVKTGAGDYEFFDGPGFHPGTRESLHEVTPQVFEAWSTLQRQQADERAFKATESVGQNFATGHSEPLRWYSLRDGVVQYFNHAGVDPVTGVKLQAVTAENARQVTRWEHGEVTRVEPKDGHFFNTITGEPIYWFGKTTAGDYELFDGPGFHPTTRAQLEPVSPDVVLAWQKQQSSQTKAPESVQPAVPELPVTSEAASEFVARELAAVSSRNVSGVLACYADQVDYEDQGVVSQDAVRQDYVQYFNRWPNVMLERKGPVHLARNGASDWELSFGIGFDVNDPATSRRIVGTADENWGVTIDSVGVLRIKSHHERITHRDRSSGNPRVPQQAVVMQPQTTIYQGETVSPQGYYVPPQQNPFEGVNQFFQNVQSVMTGQPMSQTRTGSAAENARVQKPTSRSRPAPSPKHP